MTIDSENPPPSKYSQRYSPNSINTFYVKCEEQFNQSYVKNSFSLPEFEYPYAVGSSVHDIILEYFSGLTRIPTERDIDVRVRNIFNKYFDFALKKTKKSQIIMNTFIKFEINELKKSKADYLPIAVEEKFRDDIFTCKFDVRRIDRIIDWKTSSKADPKDWGNIVQASVYYHAPNRHGYGIKEVWFVFLYVGKVYKMKIMPFDKLIGLIEHIEYCKRKSKFSRVEGQQCYFCGYRLACQFTGVYRWNI